MKMNVQALKDTGFWQNAGVELPQFDIASVKEKTAREPAWIHFGAGNIFRGFIAELQQQLLNAGKADTGIIAADTFDYDIIDSIYTPFDNLTMLVSLKPDGGTDRKIIGSVVDSLKANSSNEEAYGKLKAIFRNPSLQMASFTITEKGYALTGIDGNLMPVVKEDMENGPAAPRHAMSMMAALAYERYLAGKYPLSFVSMDNCSHNGEKLGSAIVAVAKAWEEKGLVEKGFVEYLSDESKIAFPWSMIDKITPRPSPVVEKMLADADIESMAPVVTSKNTFIAPFVNAEIPQYLVVEDKFPNGRPALEHAGVFLTDRDTVNNTERMKVTTCLNPLHTALAVYGCLLGYDSIASEMKDDDLRTLVEKMGYGEGMPVVVDPGILSPKAFIQEVLEQRLPNPFIPDMPQRIATDTSQKMAIRFGETIKSYIAHPDLDVQSLTYIPLVIAGWCRYLLGVDDNLEPFELSSDPMLEQLTVALKGVQEGNPDSVGDSLKPILSNPVLLGVDLYEAGLAEKVEGMFAELIAGKGAIRATLKKYLA